jgi:hypothetical protein
LVGIDRETAARGAGLHSGQGRVEEAIDFGFQTIPSTATECGDGQGTAGRVVVTNVSHDVFSFDEWRPDWAGLSPTMHARCRSDRYHKLLLFIILMFLSFRRL